MADHAPLLLNAAASAVVVDEAVFENLRGRGFPNALQAAPKKDSLRHVEHRKPSNDKEWALQDSNL